MNWIHESWKRKGKPNKQKRDEKKKKKKRLAKLRKAKKKKFPNFCLTNKRGKVVEGLFFSVSEWGGGGRGEKSFSKLNWLSEFI